MIIYLGADHRGFALKEELKAYLVDGGYEVVDMGNEVPEPGDDYPDFAAAVADAVSANPSEDRGIVLCGSGVGMAIVANKFIDIRCALAGSVEQVRAARTDDDVNMLALGADFTEEALARDIVKEFIEAEYDGSEYHQRRIDKITELELGPIMGESPEEEIEGVDISEEEEQKAE